MFVGHYSSAFIGKRLAPQVPLWVLLLAAQLVDVAWALFVLIGIERFSLDPSLPSNPLVLEYMPFTHSLIGAIAWGVLGGAIVLATPRLGGTLAAAAIAGLVVVSHWVLDLVVHRPDLTLFGVDPKLGLGLWNLPLTAFAVEIAVLVAAAAWYARGASAAARRAVARGVGVLIVLQVVTMLGPVPPSTAALALSMLVTFCALAWAAARGERRLAD
jgi:hypothetical protein